MGRNERKCNVGHHLKNGVGDKENGESQVVLSRRHWYIVGEMGNLGRADIGRLGDDGLDGEIAVAVVVVVERPALEHPAPVLAEEYIVECDQLLV